MNDSINTRVALLRKKLNLTQSQFAEKIGLKFSAISMIELGKTPVTEVNIKAICYAFSVREDWLRFGSGEMFDIDEAQDADERILLEIFRQLTPEMQDVIFEHVKTLAEAEKRQRQEVERGK